MTIKNVICDIDGVLMHDNAPYRVQRNFCTGLWIKACRWVADQLSFADRAGSGEPLCHCGVDVPDSVFYTSAMATADFRVARKARKRMWWAKAH